MDYELRYLCFKLNYIFLIYRIGKVIRIMKKYFIFI